MEFLEIHLKNKTQYKFEHDTIKTVCAFLNVFILQYFIDMTFDYRLNIHLVSDTDYWGEVEIDNKKVECLRLSVRLFEDFVNDNINDDKKKFVILRRNNTILHELIHIRNKLKKDIYCVKSFKLEVDQKNAVIERMIDEYLAVYESNKVFKMPIPYTERIFKENITDILNSHDSSVEKQIRITYIIATLVACKHIETGGYSCNIITDDSVKIKAVYQSMLEIISDALWFYNSTQMLDITKSKLRPSIGTIFELITRKDLA